MAVLCLRARLYFPAEFVRSEAVLLAHTNLNSNFLQHNLFLLPLNRIVAAPATLSCHGPCIRICLLSALKMMIVMLCICKGCSFLQHLETLGNTQLCFYSWHLKVFQKVLDLQKDWEGYKQGICRALTFTPAQEGDRPCKAGRLCVISRRHPGETATSQPMFLTSNKEPLHINAVQFSFPPSRFILPS
uniref:Uncharacterized protein n=1 Tax=Coturnix japonica TaxID=93934 RepID=A0A8C2TRG4_COTJA